MPNLIHKFEHGLKQGLSGRRRAPASRTPSSPSTLRACSNQNTQSTQRTLPVDSVRGLRSNAITEFADLNGRAAADTDSRECLGLWVKGMSPIPARCVLAAGVTPSIKQVIGSIPPGSLCPTITGVDFQAIPLADQHTRAVITYHDLVATILISGRGQTKRGPKHET